MWTDDLPTQLETQRLVLRRARADDAAVYREMWTERDPRVPPHRRIDADGRPSVDDIAERIRSGAAGPSAWFLTVTRVHERDVIGYCGLLFNDRGAPGERELAYELLRRAHGAGYATEAAAAVVSWAAGAGVDRMWAGIRAWNVASRNVVRKLGFVDSGRIEPDTTYGDSVIMVWESSSARRP